MQATTRTVLAAAFLLGSGAAYAPLAWAQGNPSADAIIRGLTPGSGMTGTTRGIRPATPAAPAPANPGTPPVVQSRPGLPQAAPPPVAARPAQPAEPAQAAAPSVNLSVQFATGSATLTPAAMRTLDELGRALSSPALAAYRFRIEGHTDTVGSAETNKALSDRRAAAVLDYLASKFAIDRTRIETAGMGQDALLVQTPPQTPEARNRRVQVINLGA